MILRLSATKEKICTEKYTKALDSGQGPNYKKILRLSYDVIITYDNRKSNLR